MTPQSKVSRSPSRCPKCGTAKKSGKYSCCARGGAWFTNCGDAGDTQFEHTWAEGVEACESRLPRDGVLRAVFVWISCHYNRLSWCLSPTPFKARVRSKVVLRHSFRFSLLTCVYPRCLIEASATAFRSVVSSNGRCDKCGIIKKSGKYSCCAHGGAWFKKCGNVGAMKFDHTWAEGVEACNQFASSVSFEPRPREMLRHAQYTYRHAPYTYRHAPYTYPHAELIAWLLNSTRARNATKQQIQLNRHFSVPRAGIIDSDKDCVALVKVTVWVGCLLVASHL